MEIFNNILKNNNLEKNNLVDENVQNDFLKSSLGKSINFGIDIGLRYLLPDFIEGDIIEIKDCLINQGLNAAVDRSVEKAITLGKNVLGLFTGKFENIEQAEYAIKEGGLINGLSNGIDFLLDKIQDTGIISEDIIKKISSGKEIIFEYIEYKIKENFKNQYISMDHIEELKLSWNKSLKNEDFNSMKEIYNEMINEYNNILPLEKNTKEILEIDNLNNLISNNNGEFTLTEEQLELAKIL